MYVSRKHTPHGSLDYCTSLESSGTPVHGPSSLLALCLLMDCHRAAENRGNILPWASKLLKLSERASLPAKEMMSFLGLVPFCAMPSRPHLNLRSLFVVCFT